MNSDVNEAIKQHRLGKIVPVTIGGIERVIITPGITISEPTARAILRLLEDVRDIDERARCSDVFFRQHFLTMARIPAIIDAAAEIKGALDATDAERVEV